MKCLVLKPVKRRKGNSLYEVFPGTVLDITNRGKAQDLIRAGIIKPITEDIRRPFWQHPDGSCHACYGIEAWLSVYGVWVCKRCHPPATDEVVSTKSQRQSD